MSNIAHYFYALPESDGELSRMPLDYAIRIKGRAGGYSHSLGKTLTTVYHLSPSNPDVLSQSKRLRNTGGLAGRHLVPSSH